MSILTVLLIILGAVLFTAAALLYAVRTPAGTQRTTTRDQLRPDRTSGGHRIDKPQHRPAKTRGRYLYAR